MKLTTQQEADIIAAYKSFWVANLSANMKAFAGYLVDDFSIFGSAVGETYFSKKDAISFYTSTAEELKDKAELRNREISIQPMEEDMVVCLELSDLYVLIGNDWTFYGHARISCVMRKMEGGWKAVHQHASFPDHRTEEGQQLAAEKIAKENFALKEAVERRTVELKQKNRELEIEAALERIRAVAMGMTSANDLLEISKTQFIELKQLGFEALRNSLIGIFHTDKDYLTDYDYSDLCGGNSSIIPLNASKSIQTAVTQMKRSTNSFTEYTISGEELAEWKTFREQNGEYDDPRIKDATILYYYFYSISNGAVGISTFERITAEQVDILKKFRNVFDLAYKRYVDISNAEAQAREAQIEIALERIRSRSMAMHKSEELKAVIQVVFEQFIYVNIPVEHTGFIIDYKERDDMHIWLADQYASPFEICIPYFDSPHWNSFMAAKEKGDHFFTNLLNFDEKNKFYRDLFKLIPALPEDSQKELFNKPGLAISTVLLDHVGLYMENFTATPFTEEENSILLRFGKVFQQTYTRFLDLQKAEAQTREAQVEAALENVRSRSLLMHKSDEIGKVIWVIVEKMKELNIEAQGISMTTFIPGSKDIMHWHANEDFGGQASTMFMPYFDDLIINDCIEAINSGQELLVKSYSKEEKNNYFNSAIEFTDFKYFPEALKLWTFEQPSLSFSYAIQKHSGIFIEDYSGKIFSKNENDILIRFSKVFEQSYVRFLDLQKAEAQTKEAQIEMALEKVRSRTMAMQHSNELADTASVLFQQIKELGFQTWSCGFCIWQKDDMAELWMGADSGGLLPPMHIPYKEEITHRDVYDAARAGATSHHNIWEGAALEQHYTFLNTIPSVKEAIDMLEVSGLSMPEKQCYYAGFFEQGYLLLITREPNNELKDLSIRFAKVFEQTYTRFLDLQKAEQQTRLAQIELAVERVRAKALAMHSSKQIGEVVATLRHEMLGLEIQGVVAATIYLQEEEGYIRMWDLSSVIEMHDGFHVALDIKFKLEDTDPGLYMRRVWNNKEPYFIEKQEADDMVITLEWLRQYHPEQADEVQQFLASSGWKYLLHPTIQLTHGKMSVDIFDMPVPAEMESILVKMGAAFDLAYKRFIDLQRSEMQMREAQVELSLERVRARTMAMQHSDELADASFVLDTQVRSLGIQTRGCAFNIYGENGSTEWFSSEMGAMAAYQLPRENLFLRYFEAGNSGEQIHIEKFEGETCVAHYDYLSSLPGIGDGLKAMIAAGGSFPTHQVDHAVYFKYGYLLFITTDEVPEAHDIFIRFAKVFEQTYTRFLDLQKAEAQTLRAEQDLLEIKAARKKAEEALTELKAAQAQLVQAEKMASLGELTAGIAHEIQNPLNFVNNFSEINNELIEELKIQKSRVKNEEEEELLNDIFQNNEKINQHGKRADAIVKGMLQHSRKSEGQKELTDINALCDEYLRLSYHGLRAKDKSFNATLKTDFDESIGKINIVPQDIGRVIMNILTNAFYAVNALSGLKPPTAADYKPTVSISTKRLTNSAEIKVSDNGPGIPQPIIEKIFQPFFTTKPTGQGTGLGLSLSYDIIRAHGGTLKVESRECEGSLFIIELPVKQTSADIA